MTVPTGSYTDASQKDLLASEQTGMISALLILANNDSSKTMNDLTLTTITPANLTTSKLDDLLNIDVLIVYRLVSSGVIGANIDTPESLAVLGDPNFDANAAGDDVKKAELLALIDVMTILGVTNVGDIAASITYATIDLLAPADVTTLMAAPNTIVYHLISDMLIDHIGAAGIALLPDGDFVSPAKTRFTRLAIIAYIND